jgi:hypothetical protein
MAHDRSPGVERVLAEVDVSVRRDAALVTQSLVTLARSISSRTLR